MSAETISALKKLGFEVLTRPESAKLIIGRIDAGKLDALSKLAAVTWIAPAR